MATLLGVLHKASRLISIFVLVAVILAGSAFFVRSGRLAGSSLATTSSSSLEAPTAFSSVVPVNTTDARTPVSLGPGPATMIPMPTATPTVRLLPTSTATRIPTPMASPGSAAFNTMKIASEHLPTSQSPGVPLYWSPNGSLAASVKLKDHVPSADGKAAWGRYDLWITDPSGANVKLLASNGGQPVWSFDGQWIYYVSFETRDMVTAASNMDIHRIRPDGTGHAVLYTGTAYAEPTGRSALAPLAGGRLAFVKDNQEIGILDGDGHLVGTLPNTGWSGDARNGFVVSPDGRFAGIVSANGLLKVGALDGDSLREAGNTHNAANVAWSPDSKSLTYCTIDGLWLAEADGSNSRKIVDANAFPGPNAPGFFSIRTPFWSPDGRLIFLNYGQSSHVPPSTYLLDVSSGRIRTLTDAGRALISLSPDGRTAVFQQWDAKNGAGLPLVIATLLP